MNRATVGSLAVGATAACSLALVAWGSSPAATSSNGGMFPSDGTSAQFNVTNTDGDGTTRSLTAVEYSGPQRGSALLAMPLSVATGILDVVAGEGDSIESVQLWQLILTPAANAERDQNVLVFGQTEAGMVQYARYGTALTSVFDPPLVIVPAGANNGDTWEQTGAALPEGAADYDLEASVAVDGDCYAVTSTLRYLVAGAELFSFGGTDRWCEGKGLVMSTSEVTTAEATTSASLTLEEGGSATPTNAIGVGAAPTWSAPDAWVESELPYTQTISFFGPQSVLVDRRSQPVAMSADGGGSRLAVINSTGDLVGLTPSEEGTVVRWRARPGGSAIALGAVGDVVVVSTSQRNVVAYDSLGVRLWTRHNRELVLAPPTDIGDGLVALVALDATVMAVDAATGEQRWTASMLTDADLPAVRAGNVVAASDRSGELIAFDAATGTVRWQLSTEPLAALASASDLIIAISDGGVTAFAAADGAEVWTAEVSGTFESVASTGDLVAISTDRATTAFDATTGEQLWTAPPTANILAVGELVTAVTTKNGVEVHDRSGRVVASWAPAEGSEDETAIALDGDGLLILHGSESLTRLGST